ncbi:hypothetical protein [Streptomyces cylindrosporus]|uniref:Uncharacterized protein n=1 Tax=Streptomyces cylindrosporus TaxID=2927583 RepID=A0ABS9YN03_9ACTN|nr:hypothetical protein [Streptomyces cylindrosporus]MCI3278638.1 hypothetical protein [Streptomyces cylindrosporus]
MVAMPRKKGRGQAEITDAGRFHLEHGHHPDRPELAPRPPRAVASEAETPVAADPPQDADPATETKPVSKDAVKPPSPSPAAVGPTLIAQVQKAGRFLRITGPGAEERARYRRAFDAARQCALEEYHLMYSRRAKGDFFLGLLRVTGEDDTEWNCIRLARSRAITDGDDVLAAATKDQSAFTTTSASSSSPGLT